MQPGPNDRFKRGWRHTLHALLPQDCALCAAPTDGGIICSRCDPSIVRLGPHCPRCALPSAFGGMCGACIKQPPHFDRTVAAGHYAFPLDRLLLAYKYHANLAYAALFADMLCNAIGSPIAVDLVIPMPLHVDKLRERGFNQAHELARKIAPRLGLRVDAFAAARVHATAVQADLSLDARARNVRQAFSASAAVMGRRVAVVDDVMTTGATLDELARTLKAHGALRVENWVVARALLNP